MQCSHPITLSHGTVSCGQCMSCRINRSRLWTSKLLMESMQHPPESQFFSTLTYSDDLVPRAPDGRLSLLPRHGVLFRMRLYTQLGVNASAFRYFFVGEYGDKTQRPHYHMISFGLSPLAPQLIDQKWQQGFTLTEPVTPQRLAYVAGYCTKKMTRADDSRLGSRHPEYSQMSRRPALGDTFVQSLRGVAAVIKTTGDVPSQYRWQGGLWPFSQRHKRMMRAANGLPVKRMDIVAMHPALQEQVRYTEPPTIDELLERRQREVQRVKKAAIYKRHTV
ncbi:replication initiator protein [robinz microvirus RP_86]|nr:replication initiator protein [robinz microvirus RP_86]